MSITTLELIPSKYASDGSISDQPKDYRVVSGLLIETIPESSIEQHQIRNLSRKKTYPFVDALVVRTHDDHMAVVQTNLPGWGPANL